MQRLMVTSATYRQSSKVTQELLEKDPENRLLARGPRARLPAEMIHDTALAAGGLSDPAIGGPSVSHTSRRGSGGRWPSATGSRCRATSRAMVRTCIAGVCTRFGSAPIAGLAGHLRRARWRKCTARRTLTDTPLQALALMNDPTYVEAARALAQRALLEGGRDADGPQCAPSGSRPPGVRRRRNGRAAGVAGKTVQPSAATGSRHGDLVAVGEWKSDPRLDASELAAWWMVSSTILNLDETIHQGMRRWASTRRFKSPPRAAPVLRPDGQGHRRRSALRRCSGRRGRGGHRLGPRSPDGRAGRTASTFRPRRKRVIFLHQSGGPSQLGGSGWPRADAQSVPGHANP